VRPCPDPDRSDAETKWMTKEQIQAEAMKPSHHWVQAGAGSLGKLYLELISCDSLPNMDRGNVSLNIQKGDKTDAFACIVYEDVIVNTDVISNTLSPRWMPWCHRAFAFNIMHPSSDVFVGIFDHDPEQNPLHMVSQMAMSSLHDPIGRIVINLSHFKPDTVYLLQVRAFIQYLLLMVRLPIVWFLLFLPRICHSNIQYPLYLGELKEHRVSTRGIVTLRLRMEFPSVRKAVLGGVTPPPPSTVSVARHVDFNVAHYTTDGIIDDSNFSLETLTRYIEELQSYERVIEPLKEAFLVVCIHVARYRSF
jgi:C2 domain